ncbi:hypothetical protein ISCGN_001546 [Ixodes scapularis]
METSPVPEEWKESWNVPIPKPRKPPTELASMRPISLTSNLCKLMKRLVLGRIQWYNNVMDPRQTGFRPHLSTQDSHLLIYQDVLEKKHKLDPNVVVTVYVKKAFDSAPHHSIIKGARQSAIVDKSPPVLIQEDSDDEEEPNWDEKVTLARLEQRRVLRNILPEDDDPIPYRGVKILISGVPGHAGIERNERALEAARELIPSPYLPATGQSAIVDKSPPVLIQEDSDDEEEPNWDEKVTLARLEQRRVLRNILPEDDDPIPYRYGRWATARLRRLRTGTAVSPAVRAKFERYCVELSRTREKARRKLQPKLRPGCLRDWIHPRGAPQHRKVILNSLLDYAATADIQDSI